MVIFFFKAQLEQAELCLTSVKTADGPSSLSMLVILLKAQYCYSTGQVSEMSGSGISCIVVVFVFCLLQ